MKIGLFGGSFDPIHRGHIEPVREARRLLGLDRVIYLPHGEAAAQAPAGFGSGPRPLRHGRAGPPRRGGALRLGP